MVADFTNMRVLRGVILEFGTGLGVDNAFDKTISLVSIEEVRL